MNKFFKNAVLGTASVAAILTLSACSNGSVDQTPAPDYVTKYGLLQNVSAPNNVDQYLVSGQFVASAPYTKKGTQAVIDNAVVALATDPTLAPFFNKQLADNGELRRLRMCLDLQFTSLLAGVGTYPGNTSQVYGAAYTDRPTVSSTTGSGNYACESMATAHAGLGISSSVFDRFISVLGTSLISSGVTSSDAARITSALLGFKTDIVTQ